MPISLMKKHAKRKNKEKILKKSSFYCIFAGTYQNKKNHEQLQEY